MPKQTNLEYHHQTYYVCYDEHENDNPDLPPKCYGAVWNGKPVSLRRADEFLDAYKKAIKRLDEQCQDRDAFNPLPHYKAIWCMSVWWARCDQERYEAPMFNFNNPAERCQMTSLPHYEKRRPEEQRAAWIKDDKLWERRNIIGSHCLTVQDYERLKRWPETHSWYLYPLNVEADKIIWKKWVDWIGCSKEYLELNAEVDGLNYRVRDMLYVENELADDMAKRLTAEVMATARKEILAEEGLTGKLMKDWDFVNREASRLTKDAIRAAEEELEKEENMLQSVKK